MFWRTVRGMIPHKTARGAAAMERLKTFEGIPPPYDHKKRMVVPQALRVLRLKPGRKYCTVGRLGAEFGWKYKDVVERYVGVGSSMSDQKGDADRLMQARGEEKSQGCRLLRAQEGYRQAACRGREERQGLRGDQEAARFLRLLDGWDSLWRRVGSFGRWSSSVFLKRFHDFCSKDCRVSAGHAKSVCSHDNAFKVQYQTMAYQLNRISLIFLS